MHFLLIYLHFADRIDNHTISSFLSEQRALVLYAQEKESK